MRSNSRASGSGRRSRWTLFMKSTKHFCAPRLTMAGCWSQVSTYFARSVFVNFCDVGFSVLNRRRPAGVFWLASSSATCPRERSENQRVPRGVSAVGLVHAFERRSSSMCHGWFALKSAS